MFYFEIGTSGYFKQGSWRESVNFELIDRARTIWFKDGNILIYRTDLHNSQARKKKLKKRIRVEIGLFKWETTK